MSEAAQSLRPVPVRRVRLRNFRSIAWCDVELRNLTVLVGPNATGKSNFLDGLQFVRDALDSRLDYALRTRGGLDVVRRKSGGHPTHFTLRIDLTSPKCGDASYVFEIAAGSGGAYRVKEEVCKVSLPRPCDFHRRDGDVEYGGFDGLRTLPAPASDVLFLPRAGEEFKGVLDVLLGTTVYAFNPVEMRQPQPPEPYEALARDGHNLGSVLRKHPSNRVNEYLSAIVPGIERVEGAHTGGYDTFRFRQGVQGQKHPWTFPAASMSDGTLRALAILVALLTDSAQRPSLIAIEEIEAGLHPGAAGVLWDALLEASRCSQLIVSTHSPDLLDRDDLEDASLLGVSIEDGRTVVGPPSQRDLQVLREQLCTAGELMRQVRLQPDRADDDGAPRQEMFQFPEYASP